MNLTTLVHLLNYGLVLIFGIIASFYLADYPFPAHKRAYCLTIIGFSLMELIFYLILGEDVLYKCYPLLIHLPLIFQRTFLSLLTLHALFFQYFLFPDLTFQHTIFINLIHCIPIDN